MAEQKKLMAREPVDRTGTRRAGARRDATKFAEKADLEVWKPKTVLGKKVKTSDVKDLKEILDQGKRILEPEIVEILLPNLESDLILIGQMRGKFGGGKRRWIKQTQKKTKEGNKPVFTSLAVVGNKNGFVGVGKGTSQETRPARNKAIRKAKLNVIQVARGCGSWKCACGEPHSLPFEVEGGEGSVRVKLMPAPKGTGLVVDKEIKKILSLAGYQDIWAKTSGQTRQKSNFVSAIMNALSKTCSTRVREEQKSLVKKGAIS